MNSNDIPLAAAVFDAVCEAVGKSGNEWLVRGHTIDLAAGYNLVRSEETSMTEAKRVTITLDDSRPIVAELSSLQTTCPTCSMVHTLDISNERSARMDVESFVAHAEACRARTTVT